MVLLTVKLVAPQDSATDTDDASAILTAGIAIDASGAVTASENMAIGGIDPVSGEVVSGVLSGVVTHTIPKAESDALTVGNYVYDISVTDAAGRSTTVINGASWVITADIGRRVEV